MNPYEVIIRPIDTEKTRYQASELGKHTLEVHPRANKIEIKRAFEEIFEVRVAKVNVMIMPAKLGRRPLWKKAVVTLVEGERLDLFGGVV